MSSPSGSIERQLLKVTLRGGSPCGGLGLTSKTGLGAWLLAQGSTGGGGVTGVGGDVTEGGTVTTGGAEAG